MFSSILTNTTSLKGDFLDHALDRYADVFIVGGLALSSWCDLRIGFFAIIGMLLTSYMGTQSQAVGYKRVYAGLLGRADRLVLLIVAPILQHIFIRFDLVFIYNFTLLEWVLIYIAVVGNLTAVQRFVKTMNYFNKYVENRVVIQPLLISVIRLDLTMYHVHHSESLLQDYPQHRLR